MENSYYVYMVECSDKTIYTGIAKDVFKRVLKHNEGKGAKYTKMRLPVALKWFKTCENRSEASKLEYKIKKLTRKEKLKKIMNIECDYLEGLREDASNFKELYNKRHAACPKCGETEHESEMVGFALDLNDLVAYKNLNHAYCVKCKDIHTVHDRVPNIKV